SSPNISHRSRWKTRTKPPRAQRPSWRRNCGKRPVPRLPRRTALQKLPLQNGNKEKPGNDRLHVVKMRPPYAKIKNPFVALQRFNMKQLILNILAFFYQPFAKVMPFQTFRYLACG